MKLEKALGILLNAAQERTDSLREKMKRTECDKKFFSLEDKTLDIREARQTVKNFRKSLR